MKNKLILGAFFAITSFGVANAAPVTFNGTTYDIIATNFANQAAAAAAASASTLGGVSGALAYVGDQGLAQFLIANLYSQAAFSGASTAVWIDGVAVAGVVTDRRVTTIDGRTPYQYTNFAPAEPNNGAGAPIMITTSATGGPFGYNRGEWFDVNTASTGVTNAYALVQYGPSVVPVPASMPMMAAGLGALVFMARRKKKAKEAAAKLA